MTIASKRIIPAILVHADDFGITPGQSQQILDCSTLCGGQGALNSTSVLVTSPHFEECAELLRPYADQLLVGLHLNLVEGVCAASPCDVPLLVDDQGVFKRGFVGMLLVGVVKPRQLREQLKNEIEAQIDLFLGAFPSQVEHLRIDSHQHFHLIPAVFDSLLSSIKQRSCSLEYLRIPAEPTAPFLSANVFSRVPIINWVKHVVLNALWRINRKKVPELTKRAAVFCGINFSGRMTKANLVSVLDIFKALAQERGASLELLFHPGGVEHGDDVLNPMLAEFVRFYTSPMRLQEAQAITLLEDLLVNE